MDQGDDPYKLLGVTPTATDDEVKKAYRKLALKHHPDRQSDETSRAKAQHTFARIAGAYEILMDTNERKAYDRSQREQSTSTGRTRGFDQQNTDMQFDDPYEVFKRSFKDEFGFDYPGAKFDFAEIPEHRRVKEKAKHQKLLTNGHQSTNKADSKKGGAIANGPSSSDDRSGKRNSGMLTLFRGKKERNDQLAKRNEENRLAKAAEKQTPNNRPTSMETTEQKIKHKDGTVETVTTTTMTRPDGSTETLRTTDKADKQPGWTGKKKLMLTNGDKTKPQGRLTNGKKVPLLTNGKQSSKASNKNNNNMQMVAYEQPKEQPKSRGLFGFGKRK
jgi:curved DNA-binding protein CbpA